jgi:hypothetical protein
MMILMLNLGVVRSGFIVGREVTRAKQASELPLHRRASDKMMS